MVKLKFIERKGSLALRISEGKERYYKSMGSLLRGNPNISLHWDASKQKFSSHAVCYSENNRILEHTADLYRNVCEEHPELGAREIAIWFSREREERKSDTRKSFFEVRGYLQIVIERERQRPGCNFEVYEKLLRKCDIVLNGFDKMLFAEMDYDKCYSVATSFAKHPGYRGTAKAFRALLGKASKDRDVNFSITSIGDFSFTELDPNRFRYDDNKPDVLSDKAIRDFLHLDLSKVSGKFGPERTEIFHDFCVFMMQSFLSPCDVLNLKSSCVTRMGTISTRRKKTHKGVEIPVTDDMKRIIDKYKGKSIYGYVFPIMNDYDDRHSHTKDFTLKQFRKDLNLWLKDAGRAIGVPYGLYAYVFRHTAITVAIDRGLPVAYVAMTAGTSIEMIQKHYYNGNSAANAEKLKAAFSY